MSEEATKDAENPDRPEHTGSGSKAKEGAKKAQGRKAKLPGDEMLVAKVSFAANGKVIRQGTVLSAKDPLVAGRVHLFAPHSERVRTR